MVDVRSDQSKIQQLGRGQLGGKQARQLVRSMLADTAAADSTAAVLRTTDFLGGESIRKDPQRYSSAWQATAPRVEGWGTCLTEDAEGARELFDELVSRPLEQQRLMICNDSRFHSWSLCELLLEASWEAGFNQPKRALELAESAVSVAYELPSEKVAEPLICDLKARSWSYLGNARRIASDLRGAEKAFELADSWIGRGSGDPLEEARVCELRASLFIDTRRLDEAAAKLRRAMTIYRRIEDQHRQGRVMISQGRICGRKDQVDEAIGLLRKGLAAIDPEIEPRLMLVATHNLCFLLNEQGNHEEALAQLQGLRSLHARLEHEVDLVRLRWLEGRIALAAQRIDEAQSAFAEVRQAFIDRVMGYDAALASLDLASVYARKGNAAEMRKLAEEMIAIFQSRDVQREAMAALIVLQEAARMESASQGLIEELSSFLKQARNDKKPES